MNESAEPSPSPDAVKEEMTVMTEPDDKQSTGISPDTPREEAVNHVTEDIPLQPEPFLPESDGPEEYENYSAYQELMNNENPEHLQENSDMPSHRTQTTFRQMSQNFRPQQILQNRLSGMNPLHSNLFRAHHLLIILHRFSTKRVAFLRVKKRIHRHMRTVIPRPQRKPRRLHRYLTVLSTPRNVLMPDIAQHGRNS